MKFTQDTELLFRKGIGVNELGNIFMALNSSSIRQTRTPLSLSQFVNNESGLTVDLCDGRHHTRLSIPRSEFGPIQSPILHNHDYFELMFVQQGTLKIQIEDTLYTYQKGDACLFDRNIHHAEVQQENTSIIYCCIARAFLDTWPQGSSIYDQSENKCLLHFFQRDGEQEGAPNMFAEFRDRSCGGSDQVISILRHVQEELIYHEAGSWLVVCGMFCRLLHALTNPEFYGYQCVKLKNESLVDKARTYIESAPGRVSREDIAAAMHYSSDYLNRVFRQHTGMTLSAYCTYTYMKKAASLLLQTDDTVEEIAEAVGFTNPSQFYRQFRKFFHVTPQAYRSVCSKILDTGEQDTLPDMTGDQIPDNAARISSSGA